MIGKKMRFGLSTALSCICALWAGFNAAPPAAAQISMLTSRNDNSRTSQNLSETILTTSNVNVNSFGKIFTRSVDGQVYAQILYMSNILIPGKGTHNVIFVCTMHNSVYAYDADDPAQSTPLWQVSLGTSVPAGDMYGGCSLVVGEVGITSTPVIDPSTNTIYVCADDKDANSTYHHRLHALDITTGADKFGGPADITASGFTANTQIQRAGLLLANSSVYVTFTSACDQNSYHGWMFRYSAANLSQTSVYNNTPTGSQGGIWMAGQGPLADAAGNIYYTGGNGTFDTGNTPNGNHGNSVVKLNANLATQDWFTPFNSANLNANDADLGDSGPLLIPGTGVLVSGGKEGKLYLVNTANMGKYNSSSDSVIQSFSAYSGDLDSGPITWASPNNGQLIYVWGGADVFKAFKYTGGLLQTTPIAQNSMTVTNSPPLALSANGSTAGTGIIWTPASTSDAEFSTVGGIIHAWDASNIATELWNSNQNSARDGLGNYAKFATPTIANGKVYVPTFSNVICVYGLLNSPPAPPTGLTAAFGNTQIGLNWAASGGATSYSVYRGTAAGGESTTAIATGISGTTYTNTGLTNGTTYFYKVKAVNANGTSGYSNEASAVPGTSTPTVDINAGGPAAAPFVADIDFSGGTAATNNTGAVDTSAVTSPAPVAVYQSERYGNITYTIPGLPVGGVYKVRLHFTEDFFTTSGQRTFNVSINGTSVLSNFDIFATAGAIHKANIQQFTTTVNSAGQVVIVLTTVINNAKIDGIEALPNAVTVPAPPTGLTATAGNTQVALSWTASSGATTYNVLRSTVSGSGYTSVATGIVPTSYTNTGLTNGTTYFFVVTATNSAGTSGNSNQASATPAATPPAPAGLTAVAGIAQVLLSWNASTGATSYNVKRSTVSGSGYVNVITGLTITSYMNTGLTNGTTYFFVVSAVNAGGESPNSAQASAAPSATVPQAQIASGTATIDGTVEAAWANAPAYLLSKSTGTISSYTDCSATWQGMWDATNLYVLINVTDDVKNNDSTNPWDDDCPEVYLDADHNGGTVYDANDRQLEFGWGDAAAVEGGGRTTTGVTFAKVDPTSTSYRMEIKIPWTLEAFTAAANAIIGVDVMVNDDDDGAARDGHLIWNDGTDQAWGNPSLFGTGKLNPPAGLPAPPTGVTATPGNAQITVSWTASSGATSYNVKRSTVNGSGYVTVSSPATTSFTNTGLTNGTTYYYVVTAVNSFGESGNSAQVSATPTAAPPAFVQVNSNDPVSATTIAVAYNSAQTAGNMNIVVVGWNDLTGTVSSVTDSAGNTYTRAIGPTVGSGQQQSIYYAPNIHAGANTVTVTMSFAADYPDIRVLEYSGVTTLDKTAGAFGTSAAPNSGSATTTTARELIFTANTCYPNTTGVGSGFTTRVTTIDGDIAADQSVNAIGSYAGSATLSSSNFWVMQMATFK